MHIATKQPAAIGKISGIGKGKGLKGTVWFYQMPSGILVETRIFGLPKNGSGIYGFHIHEGATCRDQGGHYNPENTMHPNHAGDLPPLISYGGRAYSAFITDRFSLKDILGRTIVVHEEADDFRTQPSGNSGERIGCGVIEKMSKRSIFS